MSAPAWTNADKAADLVPLTPAEAVSLTEDLFTQRDVLQQGQRKLAAKKEVLKGVVDLVLETQEHKEVEAAKERLKVAKERALDTPDVLKAKADLEAAKKKLGNVAVHREAKALTKEVKEIETANWELRRAMIEKLTGKRVQYVLPAAPQALPPATTPPRIDTPSARSA